MRDPDAEDEPARERLAERELPGRHRECVAGPDVGDAGRDDEVVGRREQQLGGGQHLPPDGLAGPQGAVPELLDLTCRLAHLGG